MMTEALNLFASAKPKTLKLVADCNRLVVSATWLSVAGNKMRNEDAVGFYPEAMDSQPTQNYASGRVNKKGIVALVADGVSQASFAKEASRYCVDSFIQDYQTKPEAQSNRLFIQESLHHINQTLHQRNQQKSNNDDLWLSTLCGILLESNSLFFFHVGDSQLIRFRSGRTEILTQAHHHALIGGQKILIRAMGADSHLSIDYGHQDVKAGDCFLLTSDGVHEYIDQALLTQLVNNGKSPVNQMQSLIEHAITNGSQDNLSAVLLQVEKLPPPKFEEIVQQVRRRVIPPPLEPGHRIDDYQVIRKLHQNARSHLYLVTHQKTQQKFALKAPSLNFEDNIEQLRGFFLEAWIGGQLQHKNLMTIFMPADSSPYHYHLCEYIEGQSLSEWMVEHPHPTLEIVRPLIEQVIDGLRVLKRHHIVHRDLKPDNLLIGKDGTLKIIDFGNAWIEAIEELSEDADAYKADGQWQPQGTAGYAAPEILSGRQPTPLADSYSLAVICYQMLCGHLPFPRQESLEFSGHLSKRKKYRSVKQFRPDLPDWLDNCFETALAENPSDRFQHYSEFLAELTRPGHLTVESYRAKPLIEKNPVLFWKLCSLFLGVLLLISLLVQSS